MSYEELLWDQVVSLHLHSSPPQVVKSQVLVASDGLRIVVTMHAVLGNTALPMCCGTQKAVHLECGPG